MSVPQRVLELIPWYVNGTLNEKDMDEVSEAIRRHPELAQRVQRELQLAREMKSLDDTVDLDADRAFNRLTEQLRVPRRSRVRSTAFASFLVLAFSLASFLAGRAVDGDFVALTSGESAVPAAQVLFREQSTEANIRRFILDNGSTILSGPTPRGIYRLSVPATADEEASTVQQTAEQWVEQASADPVVRWIGLEQ